MGRLMDYGYEDEVLFPFTLNVAKTVKDGSGVIHAKVDWLVCREVCIPGKAELELSVPGYSDHVSREAALGSDEELYKRFIGKLPEPLPATAKAVFASTANGFKLAVFDGKAESSAEFFPDQQDVVDNPAPQTVIATAQGAVLELKKSSSLTGAPKELTGLIELSGGRTYEIAALPGTIAAASTAASASAMGVVKAAGLAFLGGV